MKELLLIALFLAPAASPVQVRNGVVTGQLLSKDGQPVSEVRVGAMAVSESSIPVSNATTLVSFAITDSAGRYRLENVSPGRYYVMSGLIDSPTYYPGVSDMRSAAAVSVVAGAVLTGIDFSMIVPAGVTVSGRVILPPTLPIAGIVRAALIGGSSPAQETTLNVDGSFQFLKVRPGSYNLMVSAGSATPPQNVVVAERDVTGIEIVVPLTVNITGTVAVEGGGPIPRISLSFVSFKGGVAGPSALVTNGVWRTLLPEGEYQTTWASLPAGYVLKSITAGSLDLLKNPLKVVAGTSSTPIAVTLAVGSPPPWVNVSGRVIDAGAVLKSASSQLALTGTSGASLTTVNTTINPDGSFEFHQVLPGTYSARIIPALPIPPTTLNVFNKDLKDVEIVLPVLKEITGHVVIESPGQPVQRLQFILTDSTGIQIPSIATVVQPDGRFQLTLPESERRIALSAPGYTVKSLYYGSQDLIRDRLVKVSSGDASEFRVTLAPSSSGTVAGGVVGGVVGGVPGGVLSGFAGAPPPPPPPPPPAPGGRTPIRVGENVQAGNLIFHPAPAYPALARAARIEGSVILQATIAEDGSVKDLRVVTSTNPLLLTGVLDTVRTWKYKPTVLNQVPVEVITTITINFSLGNPVPPSAPQPPNGGGAIP